MEMSEQLERLRAQLRVGWWDAREFGDWFEGGFTKKKVAPAIDLLRRLGV